MKFQGFLRENGSVGIRNKILIIAVDECCEGVARSISRQFDNVVVMTNWYTCMLGGNEETYLQMIATANNPNVSSVLIIAMGCGSISPDLLALEISKSGKKVETITCRDMGGTRKSIDKGIELIKSMNLDLYKLKRTEFPIDRLVIGIKCGGTDTTSAFASNPCAGAAVDKLVDLGCTCIGGELFELQGCEEILCNRTSSAKVKDKILSLISNEVKRWNVSGIELETMSIGNCTGGVTTIEEKSLGALLKFGSKEILDVLQFNKDFIEEPRRSGFYLSEATMLCGGSGVNFSSLGAHIIIWTTGSAGFNNPITPVIRISGNKELINDDIDIDVSGMISGEEGIQSLSDQIINKIVAVASGDPTQIEGIGESTLTLYQKDQRVEHLLNLNCIK
jgi:altronate dehydratase large subunit